MTIKLKDAIKIIEDYFIIDNEGIENNTDEVHSKYAKEFWDIICEIIFLGYVDIWD